MPTVSLQVYLDSVEASIEDYLTTSLFLVIVCQRFLRKTQMVSPVYSNSRSNIILYCILAVIHAFRSAAFFKVWNPERYLDMRCLPGRVAYVRIGVGFIHWTLMTKWDVKLKYTVGQNTKNGMSQVKLTPWF